MRSSPPAPVACCSGGSGLLFLKARGLGNPRVCLQARALPQQPAFSGFWSASVQDPRRSSGCGGLAGSQGVLFPQMCLCCPGQRRNRAAALKEQKAAAQLSSLFPPPLEWNSVWVAAEGGSALRVFCIQLRRLHRAEIRNIWETRVSGLVGSCVWAKSGDPRVEPRASGASTRAEHNELRPARVSVVCPFTALLSTAHHMRGHFVWKMHHPHPSPQFWMIPRVPSSSVALGRMLEKELVQEGDGCPPPPSAVALMGGFSEPSPTKPQVAGISSHLP